MRFKTLLAGGVTLVWMLLAQPVLGATVELSRGENDGELHLDYKAAVGEINNVSIVEAPRGVYMIIDVGAPVTSQTAECISISVNAVRCAFPDEDPIILVHAEDGADTVDVDTGPNVNGYGSVIVGGAGPDTLSATRRSIVLGGLGDDRLIGRRGQQSLFGAEGWDSLSGGADHDYLQGGMGDDVIAGGSGSDTVSYSDRGVPVWIFLDGLRNDGDQTTEWDWVRADVENVSGSRGGTTFVGDAGPNVFFGYYGGRYGQDLVRGRGGDDRIYGAGGRDLLWGGAGDDLLEGYNGADVIRGDGGNDVLLGQRGQDDLGGGSGNDRLSGGRENDMLRGGPGRDRLSGNGRADVLYARDRNRDWVSGGGGHDRAQVDSVDRLFWLEVLF